MAVQVKKGTFTAATVTGNQAVTGIGFQPKAVILFATRQTTEGYAAEAQIGYGFTAVPDGSTFTRGALGYASDDAVASSDTGGTQRASSIVLMSEANTVERWGDITAVSSDGFTVTWSATGAAVIVHYIAFGGADLTGAHVGEFAAGNGSQSLTGVGFQPDVVLLAHQGHTGAPPATRTNMQLNMGVATGTASGDQWAISYVDSDADATMLTLDSLVPGKLSTLYSSNADSTSTIADAVLTSFDADGFTMTWSGVSGFYCYYLALAGGSWKAGTDTSPTSTGTKATTGVGFQPGAVLLAGCGQAASTAGRITGGAKITIGATDGTNEGCVWVSSVDAAADAQTAMRTTTTKVLSHSTADSTTDEEADLSSFDAGGFTLNWTTADGTAREFGYIAVEGAPAAIEQATTPATEAGNAQAVGRDKRRATTPATTAGSAQAVGRDKQRAVPPAAEAGNAQAITRAKQDTAGTATSTDTAQAVTRTKTMALGAATTTDTAQAIGVETPTEQPAAPALEAGEATTTGRIKNRVIGVQTLPGRTIPSPTTYPGDWVGATEAGTAQDAGRTKARAATPAPGGDAAQDAGRTKRRAITPATEAGAAQALPPVDPILQATTTATEVDGAQAVTATKARAAGTTTTTGEATTPARTKTRVAATATTTGTAQPITATKRRAVTLGTEVDQATPVGVIDPTAAQATPATEADTAGTITRAKRQAIAAATEAGAATTVGAVDPLQAPAATATEAGTAPGFNRGKGRAATAATTTDTATNLTAAKRRAVAPAVESSDPVAITPPGEVSQPADTATEVDAAQAVPATKAQATTPPAGTETAQPITATKRRAVTTAEALEDPQAITAAHRRAITPADGAGDAATTIARVKTHFVSAAIDAGMAVTLGRTHLQATTPAAESDGAGGLLPGGGAAIRSAGGTATTRGGTTTSRRRGGARAATRGGAT